MKQGDILILNNLYFVVVFVNDASVILRKDYKMQSMTTLTEAVEYAKSQGNEYPFVYKLIHEDNPE